MQTRTDTDRLLMDCFKELVLCTPVEKITIKMITDKAGVIRPTFYNHFQDKYEVIERIIRVDITNPVKVLLENEMVTEAVALIFANLQKEKDFFLKISKMEGQVTFESIAKAAIIELLTEFIQGKQQNRKNLPVWFTREHLAEYYAQEISFILIKWVQNGMNVPPREMANLYEYIMSHSMMDTINEYF